jgi:hypothetical protein
MNTLLSDTVIVVFYVQASLASHPMQRRKRYSSHLISLTADAYLNMLPLADFYWNRTHPELRPQYLTLNFLTSESISV